MRIVFWGSDDFAAVHLNALLLSSHQIIGCVTQPDRARGRGLQMTESQVKTLAVSSRIALFQPDTLNDDDLVSQLKLLNADLFVVVAYGKILPEKFLNIPGIFCINVHGSLLPRYRGAAPINWAVINGDTRTGVTVMKMSPILDAGESIVQASIDIGPQDTSCVLRERMAHLGAATLLQALEQIQSNSYRLTRQDLSQVSYAPKLAKESGRIRWDAPAVNIHNLIRGVQPWPGASTTFDGLNIKILTAEVSVIDTNADAAPGTIVDVVKDGLVVSTGKGCLLVRRLQPESGKPMEARSFALGNRLRNGVMLS